MFAAKGLFLFALFFIVMCCYSDAVNKDHEKTSEGTENIFLFILLFETKRVLFVYS